MSSVKRAVKAVLHEPPRKKAKRPAAKAAPRKRAPSSPRSNPATAPAAATAPAPAPVAAPAPAAPDKETEARAREGGPTGILLGGLLMLGGVVTVVSAVNGQLASFMAGFSAAEPK